MTGRCDANKRPCKVLVIDDDTLVRRTLRMTLTDLGYAVIEAPTGQTGLQEFRKERPDIVITDVMMPDKNGLETITELRAIDPHLRIVAMSSNNASGDLLDLASDVGAAQTLEKPFTSESVRQVMAEISEKS